MDEDRSLVTTTSIDDETVKDVEIVRDEGEIRIKVKVDDPKSNCKTTIKVGLKRKIVVDLVGQERLRESLQRSYDQMVAFTGLVQARAAAIADNLMEDLDTGRVVKVELDEQPPRLQELPSMLDRFQDRMINGHDNRCSYVGHLNDLRENARSLRLERNGSQYYACRAYLNSHFETDFRGYSEQNPYPACTVRRSAHHKYSVLIGKIVDDNRQLYSQWSLLKFDRSDATLDEARAQFARIFRPCDVKKNRRSAYWAVGSIYACNEDFARFALEMCQGLDPAKIDREETKSLMEKLWHKPIEFEPLDGVQSIEIEREEPVFKLQLAPNF